MKGQGDKQGKIFTPCHVLLLTLELRERERHTRPVDHMVLCVHTGGKGHGGDTMLPEFVLQH